MNNFWFDSGDFSRNYANPNLKSVSPIISNKSFYISPCNSSANSSGQYICLEDSNPFSGVSGGLSFIDTTDRNCFISLLFSNPRVGDGLFQVWVGPERYNLKKDFESGSYGYDLSSVKSGSDEVDYGNFVTWEVIEYGRAFIHVSITIPSEITKRQVDFLKEMNFNPSEYVPVVSAYTGQDTKSRGKHSSAKKEEEDSPTVTTTTALANTKEGGADGELDSEMAREQWQHLLNSTRPKHVGDGLWSGAKATAGGVAAGVASLVALPTLGAKEEGTSGFFKGLAKGAGAFVGLTVGGAAAGVTQVVRGAINTADAVNAGENMKWDPDLGEWVDCTVNLLKIRADYDAFIHARDEYENTKYERDSSKVTKVADTKYYDILGVSTNASLGDIKKAYRKMAIKLHPDKNLDDPSASEKFKELSIAYTTLIDSDKRRDYDLNGVKTDESSGASISAMSLDATIFFSCLFGNQSFEKFTGTLSMATLLQNVAADAVSATSENNEDSSMSSSVNQAISHVNSSMYEKTEKEIQFYREYEICEHLIRNVLFSYVDGYKSDADFALEIEEYVRANELTSANFGPEILEVIGYIYSHRAQKFLSDEGYGNFFESAAHSITSTTRQMGNKFDAYTSVAKTAYSLHGVSKTISERDRGSIAESPHSREKEEEFEKIMVDQLPLILGTIWKFVSMDIEKTSKKAIDLAIRDVSVSWNTRIRRARALVILGEVFASIASKCERDANDNSFVHFQSAFVAAMKK